MTDAGHNAVTVAAPKDSIPFDTKYKPTHTVQFDTDGIYLYQCLLTHDGHGWTYPSFGC